MRCFVREILEEMFYSNLYGFVWSGHVCVPLKSSVQFILFAFINYSTKLHVIIIHLAGSPGAQMCHRVLL